MASMCRPRPTPFSLKVQFDKSRSSLATQKTSECRKQNIAYLTLRGTAFAPRDDISEERFRAYVGGQQLPPASNETIDRIAELYPNDPQLGA